MIIAMNVDKFSGIFKTAMEVLNDPMLSPLVDELVESAAVKKIAIPGYDKEDVRVTYNRGKLTVYLKDNVVAGYHLPQGIDPKELKVTVDKGQIVIDFTNAMGKETEINIE